MTPNISDLLLIIQSTFITKTSADLLFDYSNFRLILLILYKKNKLIQNNDNDLIHISFLIFSLVQ